MNRPFLRWAGGKRWLAPRLAGLVPHLTGAYYEPFLGAGNAFFRLLPARAVLSDINRELINAYKILRDRPGPLFDTLLGFRGGIGEYKRLRSSLPRDSLGRAARFIYLNRTCWNGLYRVNKKGTFNVPYGWGDRPLRFDTARLRGASRALAHAELASSDFEGALSRAQTGDFAFVDPPYALKRHRNGFLSYDQRTFSWGDQVRLHHALRTLDAKGVHFLLTEPDTPSIRRLYDKFSVRPVVRTSTIAADSSLRGPRREVLIRNYSHGGVGEPSRRV